MVNKELVIIESPYAGDVETNLTYARECTRDSILKGEVPFASHLLYTQPGILNDLDPAERALGISLGFELAKLSKKTVVYMDLGVSNGMLKGIEDAENNGRIIEYRWLRS